MATSLGSVTIDCPGCGRAATFPIHTSAPMERDGDIICRLTLDMDAVAAHLLTHEPHDGEPLPIAS